jgi:hypothetical protein
MCSAVLCADWDSAYAQPTTKLPARSIELGVNVTRTLTAFVGNQTSTSTDPFLLSLKLPKNQKTVRIGANINYDNNQTLEPNNGVRTNAQQTAQMRIGYEKRREITPKFLVYYGLDATGSLVNQSSDFVTDLLTDRVIQSIDGYGFGGGPVLGFMYKLHPRIALSTESWFYTTYNYRQFTTQFFNGDATKTTYTNALNAQFAAPSSLYIIVTF